MEKTLHQIKDEWAKDHGYIYYKEFYELTRVVDTDQVFIMDGAVNQVAIRYAQEQNRELIEALQNVANLLDSDSQISVDSIKRVLTKHQKP